MVAIFRQLGVLHLRLGPKGAFELDHGPPIGSSLSELEVTDIAGVRRTIARSGSRLAIIFLSDSCAACQQLEAPLKSLCKSPPPDTQLIVDLESKESVNSFTASHNNDIWIFVDSPIRQAWNVHATPYIVCVDESQTVTTKGIVNTLDQIESSLQANRLPPHEDTQHSPSSAPQQLHTFQGEPEG
jgi:methylamine dehydrogenase accessory protein MauD